ncbi:hypothetical protein [Streptosporangium sp. NPDC023615]|uniref:hypothetical protein n=1 Tax=Streptosporangium sp. NPDC023615 TaxID=3154794 RepID=UPI003423E01D
MPVRVCRAGARRVASSRWESVSPSESLALGRSGNGTTSWASGHGEVRATATVAVSAARSPVALPPGVHHLHRVSSLGDLPDDGGIRFGASPRHLPHAS